MQAKPKRRRPQTLPRDPEVGAEPLETRFGLTARIAEELATSHMPRLLREASESLAALRRAVRVSGLTRASLAATIGVDADVLDRALVGMPLPPAIEQALAAWCATAPPHPALLAGGAGAGRAARGLMMQQPAANAREPNPGRGREN